jgi:hypothetical protein
MSVVIDGSAGITTPDLTDTSLTSGRVVYAGTSGNLTGSSALQFNGDGTLLINNTGNCSVSVTSSGYSQLILNGGVSENYITSDDTLSFYVGGSEGMRITTAGNVGIGTSSPANNGSGNTVLDIAAGSSKNANIFLHGGNTSGAVAGFQIQSASDATVYLWNYANTPTVFGTNGAERARIMAEGNLLVGTTSSAFTGRVVTLQPTSASNVLSVWNSATSGDNSLIGFFTDGGSGRGSITYNRGAGVVAYNVTSDYRAKDIYGPIPDSGALIDSVPVYMGKMKGATQERPMFIAHETPAYAHTGEKDAVDKDGNPVYQQMDASSLVPVMWAEIQSLRTRLTALENK